MTLSICNGRTKNLPCLGDGSQVYLRARFDTRDFCCAACNSHGTINHNNLFVVTKDIKFTSEEKKNAGLIRAKLNQIRDDADLKPAAKPTNDMVVIQCKICSNRMAVAENQWNKRKETRKNFRCPRCEKKVLHSSFEKRGTVSALNVPSNRAEKKAF